MKDAYKQKVYDTLDSLEQRVKVITEMMNGERPVNQSDAKQYMAQLKKGLETIRDIIDIS